MSAAGPAAPGGVRLRPAAARARDRREGVAATEAFSRGDAIDRDWMGWGALRVLSHQQWEPGAVREGRVANMERLLLVLEGVLEADCGGLGRHLAGAGDALWIGAGHGVESRLANASAGGALRLVELWLQPDRVNAEPAVAVREWPAGAGAGRWRLVAGAGIEAAATAAAAGVQPLPLRLGAGVLVAGLGAGERLGIPDGAGRYWLEVLDGDAVLVAAGHGTGHGQDRPGDGIRLGAGDGLAWPGRAGQAPVSVTAGAGGPARLLLLALPG